MEINALLISSPEADVLNHSLIAAFATILLVPHAATPAEILATEVVVRVYDSSTADHEDRQVSLDVAASIVSAASVDVLWVTCDRTARRDSPSTAERCDVPLAAGELALRLLRSGHPEMRRGELPLGEALVEPGARGGVLATVFVDRVAWMAAHAGVDRRTLLGRAIAHELGHLLMATSHHGSAGLMRAVWGRHELQRGGARDWLLAPADVSRIRERHLSIDSR